MRAWRDRDHNEVKPGDIVSADLDFEGGGVETVRRKLLKVDGGPAVKHGVIMWHLNPRGFVKITGRGE